MKDILEFDSLYLEFGAHRVLQDVYMKCEVGEIVGLLGRNGSGKSSLMKIVFGTLNPYMKSIRINGRYIGDTNLTKRFINYLPQGQMMHGFITVKQAFAFFELSPEVCFPYFPFLKKNLATKLSHLSTGERRIVELCCVLQTKTKFTVLDEPFSYLSPVVNEQLIQMINVVKESKGIIIADHAYRYVLDLSDRMYLLYEGKTRLIHHKKQLVEFGYLVHDELE